MPERALRSGYCTGPWLRRLAMERPKWGYPYWIALCHRSVAHRHREHGAAGLVSLSQPCPPPCEEPDSQQFCSGRFRLNLEDVDKIEVWGREATAGEGPGCQTISYRKKRWISRARMFLAAIS